MHLPTAKANLGRTQDMGQNLGGWTVDVEKNIHFDQNYFSKGRLDMKI